MVQNGVQVSTPGNPDAALTAFNAAYGVERAGDTDRLRTSRCPGGLPLPRDANPVPLRTATRH